jgi:putative transposase
VRNSAGPAADELPKQVVSWVARTMGPGSRIQVVRRLPMGSWHLNHALTVVDGGGRVHRLVLRRWARPGWDRDDPDAINVKVRDGQVANRPVYAAIGVDLEGQKDILGMWFGDGGGESAKFWMVVLTELRNRGVADVFFLVCDGLKGLPDSVNAVWPATIVQTCLIHLIRNSFRYASKKYWDGLSRDLKPIYTAVNAEAAAGALDDLDAKWGTRYPAIIRLWRNAWEEFIPFLDYDVEIRRVLCSTNAIESLNARYRRAVKARGHFPTEQAAMKCLYLVTRSLDPKGTGQTRWATRWKPALNAFAITFADRMPTKTN